MRPRGVTFSDPQTSKNLDSGIIHEESGGFTSDEPTKITMRTRVAVRDKNPHRFQVIPLRDASKIQAVGFQSDSARTLRVSTAPVNYLLRSPSGTLSPCSHAKPLRCSLSAQSLAGYSKENCCSQEVLDLNVNKTLTSDRNSDFLRFQSRETRRRLPETRNSTPRDQFKRSGDSFVHGQSPTRPLHIRYRHDKSHAKSTSFSNFRNLPTSRDNVSSRPTTTSLHRNSDNTAQGECTFRDLKNGWLLSPDTHRLVKKSLSKKRHAIYTASLVLPDFDKLAYSLGGANGQQSYSADKSEQNILRTPLQSNSGRSTSSLTQEYKEKIAHLDIPVYSRPTVRSQLEAGTGDLGDSLRDEDCCLLNSSAFLSSSPTLTDAKCASLQGSFDVDAGNIMYPQIVLDLFAQIDTVVQDWS